MSYNPYANPYSNQQYQSASSSSSSSYNAAGPSVPPGWSANTESFADDYDLAQQQSAYTPGASKQLPSLAGKSKGRTTVLRKGGGQVWEDASLMEWDPAHFRLFIGDLDPALSDDVFQQAFSGARYPSFVKAKIVRDKHTNKGKGFGFVSYKDPEDFLKAWKEMNGKYVGTRPVKISKATAGVQTVEIGAKKARTMDAKVRKKSGTEAFSRAKLAEAEGGGLNRKEGTGPLKDKKSYIRR